MYPRDFFDTHDLEYTNGTCFVAMPFASEFYSVWEDYIKPSVGEAGLKPVRVDEKFQSSPILLDILTGILDADLVIADLTTGNANVFYEVGLAHSVKRSSQVMLLTQDLKTVPFDLRHLRCYEYNLNRDGVAASKSNLVKAIKQILEEHKSTVMAEESSVKESLGPPAMALISKHHNDDIIGIVDLLSPNTRMGGVLANLPILLGISDLLHHRLIRIFNGTIPDREGYIWYIWTDKGRRIFKIGAK